MPSEDSEKLEFITPQFAQNSNRVSAFFSLKNSTRLRQEGRIPGLNVGFNTEDSSEIIEQNRSTLFNHLNLDTEWIARGGQVHSNRVRFVTSGGLYPETDGLVTVIPGLTLAIQVADCAAVLMVDKPNQVIGAIHAGWRGASSGILDNALHVMRNKGADSTQIQAYLSPCISLQHFEVGEEVAERFPDDFVDRSTFEKPHVDLKEFLLNRLVNQGVPEEYIEVDTGCTYEEAEQFYSYRREKEESGRMFALIRLNDIKE